jgi:hypothetical protein
MIYSDYPGLLLGFHGCSKEVYKRVVKQSRPLLPSTNSYDWLGSGIFTEGKPIYPGAGFRGKTHVQLCIRNIACIKGYFAPRDDEGKAIKY